MTAAGYRPAEPVEHQVVVMAATTVRRRLTEVERAERVEALTAELAAAVEALTDSAGWRSMLEVRPGSAGTASTTSCCCGRRRPSGA